MKIEEWSTEACTVTPSAVVVGRHALSLGLRVPYGFEVLAVLQTPDDRSCRRRGCPRQGGAMLCRWASASIA